MNFDLTEDQVLLAQSLEGYLADRYTPSVQAPGTHWRNFAALGWLGAALPEAVGGSGGGPVETMVVMEAFGRHTVVEPYLAAVLLGAGVLRRGGPAPDIGNGPRPDAALLAGVADGSVQLAVGYAEAQAGFDLHNVLTEAARVEGGWRLDGRKTMVLNARDAHFIIVSARCAGSGIGLFLMPGDAPGLQKRGYATQDGLAAADLVLNGVVVPASALVVQPTRGGAVLEAVVDEASAALCAMALGGMTACLEATVGYLRLRRQFGRPLASFQALQHRMVDMHVALEESRSLVMAATIALQAGQGVRQAVSAAKIHVGEAARLLGEEAVQMHGGIGMTDDYPISPLYKRLLTCATLFGDVDHHVGRYAAELATTGEQP